MTYKVEFTISTRRGAITKAVYCPKNLQPSALSLLIYSTTE